MMVPRPTIKRPGLPISHICTSNIKSKPVYLCNSTVYILSSTPTTITTHLHSFRLSFRINRFVFSSRSPLIGQFGLAWLFHRFVIFFLTSICRWRDSYSPSVCSLHYLSILTFLFRFPHVRHVSLVRPSPTLFFFVFLSQ